MTQRTNTSTGVVLFPVATTHNPKYGEIGKKVCKIPKKKEGSTAINTELKKYGNQMLYAT